jgi:hypothetical protein
MSSDFDVLKNSVVTEMFVDTADQNYLIARWAYHRGLFIDFFWNSVHALEKIFKASLLLNGKSAIGFGHDLTRLFAEVSKYAGNLFPERLTKPHQLGQMHWCEETPAKFLARFNELGDANNRYNVFGYVQRWEDLHHLDQMVYFARRVALDLDASPYIGPRQMSDRAPNTIREFLERFVRYSPRSGRLHELLSTSGDDELRDAGLKLNFQFAPDDYDHGSVRVGISSWNTVLYRRISERVNMPPSVADREAADLADWVVKNIHLPPDVKKELHGHAETLRKRTP